MPAGHGPSAKKGSGSSYARMLTALLLVVVSLAQVSAAAGATNGVRAVNSRNRVGFRRQATDEGRCTKSLPALLVVLC